MPIIEENEWIRPVTITCMTDEQVLIHGLEDRMADDCIGQRFNVKNIFIDLVCEISKVKI